MFLKMELQSHQRSQIPPFFFGALDAHRIGLTESGRTPLGRTFPFGSAEKLASIGGLVLGNDIV